MSRTLAFALALLCALPAGLALAPAAPEARVTLPGHVSAFAREHAPVGDAAPDAPLTLAVVLHPRDSAGLAEAARAVSTRERAPLTSAEMLARFAPPQARADAVRAWLDATGLRASYASLDRTLLLVPTTVRDAERAFGVDLERYQTDDGATVLATATGPTVPERLASDVQAIVGLTAIPMRARQAGPMDNGNVPYGALDLRNAYAVGPVLAAGVDGSGVRVGITGWGAPSWTALSEYSTRYGLPAAVHDQVDPNGGASCGASAQIEWDLDVQMEHAMAPGASLRVYCAADAYSSSLLAIITRAVNDNAVDVLSQSWGLCEYYTSSSDASAYETKFQQASAQGQAFFTASGDDGSRACLAVGGPSGAYLSFPSSAPSQTSVGGTSLRMSGASWSSESGWSGSGGGVSTFYARPSWQDRPAGATQRGAPDVAAVADPNTGVNIRTGGAWRQVGGTSASSPLWAGMWALVVQGSGRLGNAAPHAWAIGKTESYANTFHDVTSGSNGHYAAGPGYDHVTGWGSPVFSGVYNILAGAPASPLDVRATAGPGQGDATVTWRHADTGGDATGHVVQRRAGTRGPFADVATLGNVTSFVDHARGNGALWEYRVLATNAKGTSLPSRDAFVITFSAPPKPRDVSALRAPGAALVNVSWRIAGDGGMPLTAIDVWRAPAPLPGAGNAPVRIATLAPDARWFVDAGCPAANATCAYHVTATSAVGTSPPTDAALPSAVRSRASASPSGRAHLLGSEVFAFPLDADDEAGPLTLDASAHHYAGVRSGTTATLARFGRGYRFASAADAIDVPDAPTTAMVEGTLMVWVRLDASTLAAERPVFAKGDAEVVGLPELRLWIDPWGHAAFATSQISESPALATRSSIPTGAWVHLAATWGAEGKRLFVDGVLDAVDGDSTIVGVGSTRSWIGADPTSPSATLKGSVDELRIYDSALDETSIRDVAYLPYVTDEVVTSGA